MHLLYTDEVNLEPKDGEFFVYAGVAIPGDKAVGLSEAIDALRERNGYRTRDVLKFNTRERPDYVTPPQHLAAKRELIEVTAQHGGKLIASFLLHNISKDRDLARRWGINRVSYHYDAYLNRIKDHGLVLVDTFSDPELNKHLREKFAIGIDGKLPHSDKIKLARILGFHQSTIGASHFASVIDVVVGSLRHAVNFRSRDNPVCKTLIEQLAPLCIREENNKVSELSISFDPKNIKSTSYLATYRELSNFLTENGIEPYSPP